MRFWKHLLGTAVLFGVAGPVGADRVATRSLIDNDPEVVYVEEFTDDRIELLAVKPGGVYATKKGQRKLGNLKEDTKVTLVGFTEKAYKIRGTAQHAGVSGWVSPKSLASKDQDFVENFKKIYQRQREVRELIARREVAIGMNLDEVSRSLGRPTKTKVRQTAKGKSGQWEFTVYEEKKHYQVVRDPFTGAVYNQYTHSTQEEISKLVVEFDDDVVTAIEESENNKGGPVRIVVPPVVFGW